MYFLTLQKDVDGASTQALVSINGKVDCPSVNVI